MNRKYTPLAYFGLGAVFAVLLVLIGAQNGPFKRVFAASPVVTPASGLHAFGPTGCTNSDLKGTFGFYRIGATDVPAYIFNQTTGKYVKPPVPVAPFSNPLAAIGIIYFDGAGNGESYQRQSRQGNVTSVVHQGTSSPITPIDSTTDKFSYFVSPDCSFVTYNETPIGNRRDARTWVAQGVIVGNEDEFYMMSLTPPGGAVVVVAQRLPSQASVNFK